MIINTKVLGCRRPWLHMWTSHHSTTEHDWNSDTVTGKKKKSNIKKFNIIKSSFFSYAEAVPSALLTLQYIQKPSKPPELKVQ